MHRSKKALFDHVVGASQQQKRQLQAELPCSFFGSRQAQIPLGVEQAIRQDWHRVKLDQHTMLRLRNLIGFHAVRHEAAGLAEQAKRADRG